MDTVDASGDGSGGRLRPQAGAMMADNVFHGGGGSLRRWTTSSASTGDEIVVYPISSGDEQQMDPISISTIFMICP
ncbi:hypothetical protein ACLOJK_026704 [Asimina triloba]